MNKLELYQSAAYAALSLLGETSATQLQIKSGQQFESEKLDPLDFMEWLGHFNNERSRFASLQNQPTQSAQAVLRAAAQKPAV